MEREDERKQFHKNLIIIVLMILLPILAIVKFTYFFLIWIIVFVLLLRTSAFDGFINLNKKITLNVAGYMGKKINDSSAYVCKYHGTNYLTNPNIFIGCQASKWITDNSDRIKNLIETAGDFDSQIVTELGELLDYISEMANTFITGGISKDIMNNVSNTLDYATTAISDNTCKIANTAKTTFDAVKLPVPKLLTSFVNRCNK